MLEILNLMQELLFFLHERSENGLFLFIIERNLDWNWIRSRRRLKSELPKWQGWWLRLECFELKDGRLIVRTTLFAYHILLLFFLYPGSWFWLRFDIQIEIDSWLTFIHPRFHLHWLPTHLRPTSACIQFCSHSAFLSPQSTLQSAIQRFRLPQLDAQCLKAIIYCHRIMQGFILCICICIFTTTAEQLS